MLTVQSRLFILTINPSYSGLIFEKLGIVNAIRSDTFTLRDQLLRTKSPLAGKLSALCGFGSEPRRCSSGATLQRFICWPESTTVAPGRCNRSGVITGNDCRATAANSSLSRVNEPILDVDADRVSRFRIGDVPSAVRFGEGQSELNKVSRSCRIRKLRQQVT
jgi:hypothetical protein